MERKIIILVAALILTSTIFAGTLPFGLEAGGGVSLNSDSNTFLIQGSALVKIIRDFYLRATLVEFDFESGSSSFSAGTGFGIDLLYFLKGKNFRPYALGGFYLRSGEGISDFNLTAGGGLELGKRGRIRPFVEGSINLISLSIDGSSSSSTSFVIKGGIRI